MHNPNESGRLSEAAVRRDAQVVREHIPSGYHVAHRVADAVPLLLDEITRLRAALDEARAEVERLTEQVNAIRHWTESEADCGTCRVIGRLREIANGVDL